MAIFPNFTIGAVLFTKLHYFKYAMANICQKKSRQKVIPEKLRAISVKLVLFEAIKKKMVPKLSRKNSHHHRLVQIHCTSPTDGTKKLFLIFTWKWPMLLANLQNYSNKHWLDTGRGGFRSLSEKELSSNVVRR